MSLVRVGTYRGQRIMELYLRSPPGGPSGSLSPSWGYIPRFGMPD